MNMKPLILIPMLFIGLGVLPKAQAVSPPPDGGYSGGNTAEGQNALFSLTAGTYNTALGLFSLKSNTEGNFNTATGAGALLLNSADQNTATGAGALLSNITGTVNTANGAFALCSNTDGVANTATGVAALRNNTTGNNNTANGAGALQSNAVGLDNTANGTSALFSNTIGSNNTAIGASALFNNTTGGHNIALGISAGFNLTTGDSNIDIGNFGATGESATIRIGTSGNQTRSFIAGIRGVMTGNGNAIPVLIDSAGQLGTTSSSRRFKHEIKPMDKASEAILALKPVTFYYKNDHSATPQFGLIAEDVADVNPDLVVRDEKGEIYTVRYDAVNALLLNEFLKEHRKVEQQACKMDAADRKIQEQEATIAELKSGMKALAATINEQTLKLKKVSAQLDLNRPAPQQVVLKIP